MTSRPLQRVAQIDAGLLSRRSADVSVEYSAAIADGIVTPAENERVSSELRESIAAQRSLLELLERERAGMRPRAVRGGAA